jgi:hypothetical protein
MKTSFPRQSKMDKAYILQEIRRTATENSGTPLGSRKFVKETGIRASDWLGIYWARWSDALREAGYVPNQLTEAYESSELLQRFAEFALELERLPVKGDMLLKARNDPSFPHDATFRRLGSKLEFVQLLFDFCRKDERFEQVADWCNEYLASRQSENGRVNDRETIAEEVVFGFVYLMKSGRFYKIGHSNAAGRREYELAIQLPEKLKTIHTIRTDDPVGIEAYWHNRFKDKRKNGEWFDLTAADMAAFKRRTFM